MFIILFSVLVFNGICVLYSSVVDFFIMFGVKFWVMVLVGNVRQLFFFCSWVRFGLIGKFLFCCVEDCFVFGVKVVMYISVCIFGLLFVLVMIVLFQLWLISIILLGVVVIVWWVVVILLVNEVSGFCIVIVGIFQFCSVVMILFQLELLVNVLCIRMMVGGVVILVWVVKVGVVVLVRVRVVVSKEIWIMGGILVLGVVIFVCWCIGVVFLQCGVVLDCRVQVGFYSGIYLCVGLGWLLLVGYCFLCVCNVLMCIYVLFLYLIV